MANPYINTQDPNESDLIADLIDESINIHSQQFYYVARTISSTSDIAIFNEDRNSIFKDAMPFSGYLETYQTFEGNGFLMQKFGGIVDYSATITISKREQEKSIGRFGKTTIPNRPNEGDLIYWPTTDQLFEILFVDDKHIMPTIGNMYTYKLNVNLFQYSNEHIDTEVPEIDVFESLKTYNQDPDHSLWGGVSEVEIIDRGSGYSEPPQIVIDSLTGAHAQFFVTLGDDGGIDGIEVVDSGEQYHSTDKAYVIGSCDQQAKVRPIFRTIIENVGDGYASNQEFIHRAHEMTFDPQNPFGIDDDGR